MYITKEEIKKILAVMEEFPDAKSFQLQTDGSSGIGSILTLNIGTDIGGRKANVQIEISGVETW